VVQRPVAVAGHSEDPCSLVFQTPLPADIHLRRGVMQPSSQLGLRKFGYEMVLEDDVAVLGGTKELHQALDRRVADETVERKAGLDGLVHG